jgi:hypothetical protein
MPFTNGASTAGTPYANVSQSYNAYNYGSGPRNEEAPYGGAAKSYGHAATPVYASTTAGYGNTGGMGMDRPLPPRSGPGGYGHRPRSIDLVTPFGGH